MIAEFKLIIGEIKARFAALFALEPGAFGFAFKKGGERFAQGKSAAGLKHSWCRVRGTMLPSPPPLRTVHDHF